MRTFFILLLTMVILLPSRVAAQYTNIQFVPISIEMIMECTSEPILFEGQLLLVEHTTTKGININRHFSSHLQGVSGTNTITGEKYMYAGMVKDMSIMTLEGSPRINKLIAQINLIGTAKTTSYTTHVVISVTYDANGQLRADVAQGRMECR